MDIKKIGVITSGGDCGGLNGVVKGVAQMAMRKDVQTYVIPNGYAGLYNLISFYGATEELWFPAWDMGSTPWDEPELYNKWSPHNYVNNFKTPTLVTHGELDFRVPFAESLQLFTALQRKEIPSSLLVFHDEGHVIYGLQNNLRWWKEIHRWFQTYLK